MSPSSLLVRLKGRGSDRRLLEEEGELHSDVKLLLQLSFSNGRMMCLILVDSSTLKRDWRRLLLFVHIPIVNMHDSAADASV